VTDNGSQFTSFEFEVIQPGSITLAAVQLNSEMERFNSVIKDGLQRTDLADCQEFISTVRHTFATPQGTTGVSRRL